MRSKAGRSGVPRRPDANSRVTDDLDVLRSGTRSLLDFLRVCAANERDLILPLRGQLAAYRDQLQTRLVKRRGYAKPLSIRRSSGVSTRNGFYVFVIRNAPLRRPGRVR